MVLAKFMSDDLTLNYFKLMLKIPVTPSLDYGVLKQDTISHILRYLFPTDLIRLIPHVKVGYSSRLTELFNVIVSKINGDYFPISNRRFQCEDDYISLMTQCNFYHFNRSPAHTIDLFYDFIDNYIGYNLINKQDNHYIIDTSELTKFEIKKGYSKLNCKIFMALINNSFTIDYIMVDDIKFHQPDKLFDFKLRECMTAISTLLTLKYHLSYCHVIISDFINTMIYTTLPERHIVKELLKMYTISPFLVNEIATNSLFGKTGTTLMFNLTQQGIVDFITDNTTKNINVSNLFDIDKLKAFPMKGINHDIILWYDCIFNFVSLYLSDVVIDCYTEIFISQVSRHLNLIRVSDKTDIINICTIILFSNILHELYSNPSIAKLVCNPYILSTSWKTNSSNDLNDHINNLSEQLRTNIVIYKTMSDAISIVDKRWVEQAPLSKRQIVIDFQKNIRNLKINIRSILYYENISTSISY